MMPSTASAPRARNIPARQIHENKKAANAIDRHVARRIRMARVAKGVSQEKLGEHLGVTFQQLQKNEKAVNRVSAGRLFQIAQRLDVPIRFFFEGLEGGRTPPERVVGDEFLSTTEGAEIARAFSKISDGQLRRRIADLVSSLASGGK